MFFKVIYHEEIIMKDKNRRAMYAKDSKKWNIPVDELIKSDNMINEIIRTALYFQNKGYSEKDTKSFLKSMHNDAFNNLANGVTKV